MKCVVCKGTKKKSSHQRWFFTSERAPTSRITLLFKVYECTKTEVTAGAVCPTCYELIAHIDGLEYQVSTNPIHHIYPRFSAWKFRSKIESHICR